MKGMFERHNSVTTSCDSTCSRGRPYSQLEHFNFHSSCRLYCAAGFDHGAGLSPDCCLILELFFPSAQGDDKCSCVDDPVVNSGSA